MIDLYSRLEKKDYHELLEERRSLLNRIRHRVDSVSERDEERRLRKEEREYHEALNEEMEGRRRVEELQSYLQKAEDEASSHHIRCPRACLTLSSTVQ